MKRKLERLLSFALILSVTACCFLTGGMTNGNAARPASGNMQTDAPDPAAPIPAAVSNAPRSHGAEEGREETVYVIADASGAPTRQISSVWLKNPDEAATITDRADLEDIQNTKGDETYTVDEAGNLVWAANGNDIYYQGDSGETPPISVHIAYTLDGKPVAPEALAGASGHLVMTFTYENDTRALKIVDEKPTAMYQPFAVISCAVLDSAKAANVQVTNGRIINLGEQMVVAGLALPGLKESLGLDDIEGPDGEQLGIDIPETVTVSADVTDFSLLTTLTIAENSLLNEVDLDDVNSFDKLEDAMDELTGASTQLVDGSGQLQDGTTALAEGAGSLSAGVDELSSGADAIASNMGTLSSGLNDLESGAYTLASGLDSLGSQVQGLPGATAALRDGAQTLKDALEGQVKTGADALEVGAQTVSQKLRDEFETGATNIKTGADNIVTASQAVENGLGELPAQITGAITMVASPLETADSGIGDAITELTALEQKYPGEGIEGIISTLQESLTDVQTVRTGLATAGGSIDLSDANYALEQIINGATGISAGAAKLAEGADTLATEGSDALAAGAAQLSVGVDTIISGNDGNNLNALIDGLNTLSGSSQALVGGVGQLSDGADSLAWGAGNAASGAGQLTAGANTLASGAQTLKSGTQSLTDGITQLVDGASALAEGMGTFNEEGIQTLSRLVEDDAQGFFDRLRTLQDYAGEYTSFSGGVPGTPGTVKFIIRTDSIEKP